MAKIKIFNEDDVLTGEWDDAQRHIGSLVDAANRRKLMRDIFDLIRETRIKDRQRKDPWEFLK